MRIKHGFLLSMFSLLYITAAAQDYVVTVTGDTLRGTVKAFNFGDGKKVVVTDAQKNKTNVPIFKTRMYTSKGEIFQPVRMEAGYQYMKLLKSGYLSLYAFVPAQQSSYDGRYLMKADGQGMEVPNLSFKKMMGNFLQGCPELVAKIDNGDLGKRDLDKIIDEFNQCIENHSYVQKAVADKKPQPSKPTTDWDNLEEKIKAHADFEGKADALEMVAEIKNKVRKSEKVPNFLTEGLSKILAPTDLKDEVSKILSAAN